MSIVEEKIGNVIIETINLDRATLKEAGSLKETLAKRIDEGFIKVIIDISQCEFIDSTFLGVIVNTLKNVAKLGGDLRLVGFKPGVRAMFELTRLFRVFDTYDDVDEAIESFRK